MKVLVKKMSKLGLVKFEMFGITALMTLFFLGLPIGVMVLDITLLANPYILGILLVSMLFCALFAYGFAIRPYLWYCKAPEVLVEADKEFFYIHGTKEVKIPLTDLWNTTVQSMLPYIYQKEFLSEFIIHKFSEQYGDIYLYIPGHKTYRLRFVSNVQKTADELVRFLDKAVPEAEEAKNKGE